MLPVSHTSYGNKGVISSLRIFRRQNNGGFVLAIKASGKMWQLSQLTDSKSVL